MVDIFVSYSSTDRDWVAPLAASLAAHGWSVWWDRQIPPGKTFDQVIEEALDEAKAVIAVWSERGVASQWVRTEAAEGAARHILVPVLMEHVTLPLAFRRIQAADLTDWRPGGDHQGYAELLGALADLIGEPTSDTVRTPKDPIDQALRAAAARAQIGDWEGVIALLSPIEIEGGGADHPEIVELLETAQRARDANELYEEAEVLYAEGKWVDAIDRFDRVVELDPSLVRDSVLRERAERHIAEERDLRLARQHERATRALQSGEWQLTIALLEPLLGQAPDYRDARQMLDRARAGAESERTYGRMRALFEQEQWSDVVAGMTALRETDPTFDDRDELMSQAMVRLEQQPTPQHRHEPSRPKAAQVTGDVSDDVAQTEPVPDVPSAASVLRRLRRRLPAWGLGGLVVFTAYLPWANWEGDGAASAFQVSLGWEEFPVTVAFPVVMLGVAMAAAEMRHGPGRRTRTLGWALVTFTVVHATLAAFAHLMFPWVEYDWPRSETFRSAGPYAALILGAVAAFLTGDLSPKQRRSPSTDQSRQVMAVQIVGGGLLLLVLGLWSDQFSFYQRSFAVNGFASLGIAGVDDEVSWPLSTGFVIVVVLVTSAGIARLRGQSVLLSPTTAAPAILLVVARPWAHLFMGDKDLDVLHGGYWMALLGVTMLLLAVPATDAIAKRRR